MYKVQNFPSNTLVETQIFKQSFKAKQITNMKSLASIVIFLCVLIEISSGLKRKCGIPTPKCQLLANGNVFFSNDYNKSCSTAPICPPGYILHRTRIGELRACCCRYENLKECPDCDMTQCKELSFSEWIDFHLKRDGPPEGICKNGKLKRIFIPNEQGKRDKCCCEPRNSPYIFASET